MNYGFVDIYRDIPVDVVFEANSARKGKGKIPLDRLVDMLKVEFDVKGSATVAEISAMTGMHIGDTWAVSDSGTLPSGLALTAGDLVRWDGSVWKLILHIDLSAYATKQELGTEESARVAGDEELAGYISEHLQDKDNPHEVTAGQVGAYTKSETDEAIAEALSGEIGGWLGNLTVAEVNALTTHRKGDSATMLDSGIVMPGNVSVSVGDDIMWVDSLGVWQPKISDRLHHDTTLVGTGSTNDPIGVNPQEVVTSGSIANFVEQENDSSDTLNIVTSVTASNGKLKVKNKSDVGLYFIGSAHRMGFGTYWEG
jgi:hypothetical protein